MVRDERPRQRAAVERLQHRRLDLDEAVLVEVAAHRARSTLRAGHERRARLLVGDQVELAAAKARLDVGQAVVLVGRRAQALGEHREVVDAQRELAAARAEDLAVDADEVAEVELEQRRHALLAEHVGARLQLDPAGAVDEVQERHLALAAAGGEATGDAERAARSPRPARGRPSRLSASAAGVTPGKLCGNGSMPCARRRSSLARRAASRSETCSSSLISESDVDLRDLQLARRAARHLDRRRSRRACGPSGRGRRATRWRAGSRPGWPRPSRRSCT